MAWPTPRPPPTLPPGDTSAAPDTNVAPDTASGPLTVASQTPDGAGAASPHATIVVTFDRTIDPASVSSEQRALIYALWYFTRGERR